MERKLFIHRSHGDKPIYIVFAKDMIEAIRLIRRECGEGVSVNIENIEVIEESQCIDVS